MIHFYDDDKNYEIEFEEDNFKESKQFIFLSCLHKNNDNESESEKGHLKELNKNNTKLYINNKKYEYKKIFYS